MSYPTAWRSAPINPVGSHSPGSGSLGQYFRSPQNLPVPANDPLPIPANDNFPGERLPKPFGRLLPRGLVPQALLLLILEIGWEEYLNRIAYQRTGSTYVQSADWVRMAGACTTDYLYPVSGIRRGPIGLCGYTNRESSLEPFVDAQSQYMYYTREVLENVFPTVPWRYYDYSQWERVTSSPSYGREAGVAAYVMPQSAGDPAGVTKPDFHPFISIDPGILPILPGAVPDPKPVPWPLLPVAVPSGDPQTPDIGYYIPRDPNTDPGQPPIAVTLGGPRVQPYAEPHRLRRPRRGERERKYTINPSTALFIRRLYDAATETVDFVDALYWALPKGAHIKPRFVKDPTGKWHKIGPSLPSKVEVVIENWRSLDMRKAVRNLLVNEANDRFYGWQGRMMKRAAQEQHRQTGTGPARTNTLTRLGTPKIGGFDPFNALADAIGL